MSQAAAIASTILGRVKRDPVALYCPVKLHDRQREYLALECREALYGGSAGGGKSVALLSAALQYCDVPNYRAALFRRKHTDLMLPEALIDVSHQWLGGRPEWHWNGETKEWRRKTSDPSHPSSLSFGYLDGGKDHLRYQGAQFQFIGFDELTQLEENQYLYMQSRLRKLRSHSMPLRVRGATNPGGAGHHWVKRRFIDDPGERVFIRASWRDNPGLDHEEYEKSLNELDSITRKQLRDGEWVFDSGDRVYRRITRIPRWPAEEHDAPWSYGISCDLGWVDAASFVVLAWRRYDPTIYVRYADTQSELTVSAVARRLHALESEFGGFDLWVADPASKQVVETLRRDHQCPFQNAEKTDKAQHIKLINHDIEEGRVVALEPECKPLLDEARDLTWADAEKTKENPALPNHALDGLLYGWRAARRLVNRDEQRPPRAPKETDSNYGEYVDQQYRAALRERERLRQETEGILFDG